MDIAIAVVLGVIIGIVGFVPTFKLATHARKMMTTNRVGSLGLLILSFVVSFIVMLIAIVVCANVARQVLLPFTLALVVALSATAIGYGMRLAKK